MPVDTPQPTPLDPSILGDRIWRSRDLEARGITRKRIKEWADQGTIERVGRGVYRRTDALFTENLTLAQVAAQVPHGIVCLISALQFHGLTTQNPWQVWLLIEKGRREPAFDYPRVQTVRASGESFRTGFEEHHVEGVVVRVTNVPKTVVDCFKYRRKVGLGIALEALRQCLAEKRTDRAALRHFAQICRMERVMAPYLEALSD